MVLIMKVYGQEDVIDFQKFKEKKEKETEKRPKITTAKQAMAGYFQILSDRAEGIKHYRDCGLKALDDGIPGLFHDSHLIIIAARPSMGKSALSQQIAEYIAVNETVIYFNLEMAIIEMVERSFSRLSQVDLSKLHISPSSLSHEEWSRITLASVEFQKSNLLIEDQIFGIDQIIQHCKDVQAYKTDSGVPLGAVFIDYLQLISSDNNNNRNNQVGAISRALKLLAKELKVPVVLLSQLSRGVESREDKRPQMSDLRDSGEIEQNADSIMFIYRDEVYNDDLTVKGSAELLVRKNRSGNRGEVLTGWQGEFMSFGECGDRYER